MAETTLERVTEQEKALTSEEMQERERQFVEDMVAKGVLANIPTGKKLHPDPKPIIVHGEPVSETIIRERR